MEHQFKTHKKHKTDVCDGDWFDKVSRFTSEQKNESHKSFLNKFEQKGENIPCSAVHLSFSDIQKRFKNG